MSDNDIAGWSLPPGGTACRHCGQRIHRAQEHLGEDVYWVHSMTRRRACALTATPPS